MVFKHEIFDGRVGGFTLIELSFSLAFISLLSLAVVMVVMNAVSAYHKSITLNMLDTVGMNLVDDMRASVQASSARRIERQCDSLYKDSGVVEKCEEDNGKSLVSVVKKATVEFNGENLGEVPVYGAFCTGSHSYIWNSGYFDNGAKISNNIERATLKYNNVSGTQTWGKPIRLLKVDDKQRAVCIAAIRMDSSGKVSDKYDADEINGGKSVFDISLSGLLSSTDSKITLREEPVELLADESGGLALYDLTTSFAEQTDAVKNIYYYTSFILGTVAGGVNVSSVGNSCVAPEEHDKSVENFDYCAINKFNFAAMATGG